MCATNYFLSYNLQTFFEIITVGYKDKDLPTLKYRWDRCVDIRGTTLDFSNAYRGFRETTLNGHILKCHKPHKKLVSLYTAAEKKLVEGRGKVRLDVFRYEEAIPRYKEIVNYNKIEKTILNSPEEEYGDKNISSGKVLKV